jgi:hypothetical protein
MAGLDPAARAIEETRQSAERMMYYVQRAPLLLTWQAELLTYQLSEQPAARRVIEAADRLSKAAEAFGRTADQIPELVDEQRKAAIKQLLDGIALERTNLLASLDSSEAKLRGLLVETRGTLEAGNRMATSVDSALKSLDSFVRYVSPPPDSNAPPAVVSTNSRPFDVLDYGKAATDVAGMASNLNQLLTSVNQTMPQAAKLTQQAQMDARQVVDHAFRLALVLCLVIFAGAVCAALLYRVLVNRLGVGPAPQTERLKLKGGP